MENEPRKNMGNLKTYTAALFDLDGTLVDNYTAIFVTAGIAFKEFGITPPPTRDEVVRSVGGSILLTLKRLLAPRGREEMADEIGARYAEIFPLHAVDGLKMLGGADKILSALKSRGLKLACFTNKQTSGAEIVLRHLGLDSYLDAIVGTELHSPRKPDPAFTRMALDRIGADPSNSIIIGDSRYDYAAAQSCGMDCAIVATGADSAAFLKVECPNAFGPYEGMFDLAKEVFGIVL